MITTIQIHQTTKKQLEKLKDSKNESYEKVIITLLNGVQEQKRKNKELLIEGYKEMAKDSLEINEEWSSTDLDWD